jgi:alpha-glucoside transport system permease protein
VVPLQLALIPLLKLHNASASARAIWGLAGAYRLRPAAGDLSVAQLHGRPAARHHRERPVDGATDFQIFTKIILPLSSRRWPVLRDLPVPVDVERPAGGQGVPDRRDRRDHGHDRQIVELLGTRGGNWEILATSAFVSIAVPLVVFFAMQRYLVRGLLAGSVK